MPLLGRGCRHKPNFVQLQSDTKRFWMFTWKALFSLETADTMRIRQIYSVSWDFYGRGVSWCRTYTVLTMWCFTQCSFHQERCFCLLFASFNRKEVQWDFSHCNSLINFSRAWGLYLAWALENIQVKAHYVQTVFLPFKPTWKKKTHRRKSWSLSSANGAQQFWVPVQWHFSETCVCLLSYVSWGMPGDCTSCTSRKCLGKIYKEQALWKS